MKKMMTKINTRVSFALIALMTTMPAFATDYNITDMCELIHKLQGIFKTLRALAFIGAAFYIAAWAWDFIKGGEAKGEEIKKKSIALLVGFGLLLMVGIILTFVTSTSGLKFAGCDDWNNF